MYAGQEMELYAYGSDEQVNATCERLPEIEGLHWYLLGGNHDASHYNHGGTNVVRRICNQRDDCTYLGFAQQDIPLAPGVLARLWHPRGGVPYAVSYRAQKGAEATIREWLLDEQWSEEERARIVLLQWGHVHVKGLFWYGNMMLLGPGCFEAQTDYETERALYPDIGAAVLEVTMTDNGFISDLNVLSWKRYKPVADDFRPVKHADLLDCEEVEPLFSLGGKV